MSRVGSLYSVATLAIMAGVVWVGFEPYALFLGFVGVVGLGALVASLRSVEATVETKLVLVVLNLTIYFLGVAILYLISAGYIDLSALR